MFLALDLPVDARTELAAWRDELVAGRDDLRPVRPEALHVTLVFLGWQDEAAAQGTKADYERADRLPRITAEKVFRTSVRPHWLPGGGRFSYRNDLAGGARIDLLAPFARSRRLWLATFRRAPGWPAAGAEALRRHLARFGRPIRYRHVPTPWPLDAYQTVFATEPGSAEMPSAARPFTDRAVTSLVRRGVPGLRLVWSSPGWLVYENIDGADLVVGAGAVTAVGVDAFTVRIDAVAPVTVRIRWSDHFTTAADACLAPTAEGWTTIRPTAPGDVVVSAGIARRATTESASSRGRKPQSASNGPSAQSTSGLWLASR